MKENKDKIYEHLYQCLYNLYKIYNQNDRNGSYEVLQTIKKLQIMIDKSKE